MTLRSDENHDFPAVGRWGALGRFSGLNRASVSIPKRPGLGYPKRPGLGLVNPKRPCRSQSALVSVWLIQSVLVWVMGYPKRPSLGLVNPKRPGLGYPNRPGLGLVNPKRPGLGYPKRPGLGLVNPKRPGLVIQSAPVGVWLIQSALV